MPDGHNDHSLYDRDALAWSERQAGLLRRLAAGECVALSVDWANVIEEIEAVGRSDLLRCQSQLVLALLHVLKLHAWPDVPSVPHWRGETMGFLGTARRCFAPSMRHRMDLPGLYKDAVRRFRAGTDDVRLHGRSPASCPFTLDELLAEEPDLAALTARLGAPAHPHSH